MRTLRKTILRLLLLVVAVAVMAGCVLIGRGYQMYQAALTQQSLESKVEEIQSDSGYTELSELPEMYLSAVVAVEDHRFEQHFGIDLIAIGRAAWNNLTTWSLREGGQHNYAAACQKYVFYAGKELYSQGSRNVYGVPAGMHLHER